MPSHGVEVRSINKTGESRNAGGWDPPPFDSTPRVSCNSNRWGSKQQGVWETRALDAGMMAARGFLPLRTAFPHL